jgi:hypothetical protein
MNGLTPTQAIEGPSTKQFFFSSSDVIATTCFGHTTIIMWHTVVQAHSLRQYTTECHLIMVE